LVAAVTTAPLARADFGIEDLIMNLLDPGAFAAVADPGATLDMGILLADFGLSGAGATDGTALAIPDLPTPARSRLPPPSPTVSI
jgi:hypothetical protein